MHPLNPQRADAILGGQCARHFFSAVALFVSPLERVNWLAAMARDDGLRPEVYPLAMIIAERVYARDGEARLSADTLASALHISRRTVRRHVRALEAAGWLRVAPGLGRGNHSVFVPVMARKRGHNGVPFSGPVKGDTRSPKKGDTEEQKADTHACARARAGLVRSRSNSPGGKDLSLQEESRSQTQRARASAEMGSSEKGIQLEARHHGDGHWEA